MLPSLLHPSTSSASLSCILPCPAHPLRPQPPSCSARALHTPEASLPAGAGPGASRARAPAMLITLCYLYLWARWGRRPAALVLSTVRRLRASRCSFTFCRAAAQPRDARVCLSQGGRVFCVGESQVGGGRGRRVDGARLQLGSHSPRVHGSPGSPAVTCGPRASCPSLVSPVLQLQQAHPGHPSWHLVFPWASFWSCRRVMAAAPHWEGGTLAVCTGRLQARDLTSQCTSYHTLLDTLVSVNTIQCFAFQPSLPFPLPSGNLPHFQH